jgi:hypothetical protein
LGGSFLAPLKVCLAKMRLRIRNNPEGPPDYNVHFLLAGPTIRLTKQFFAFETFLGHELSILWSHFSNYVQRGYVIDYYIAAIYIGYINAIDVVALY